MTPEEKVRALQQNIGGSIAQANNYIKELSQLDLGCEITVRVVIKEGYPTIEAWSTTTKTICLV